MQTIRAALAWARAELAESESPALDAEVLLAECMGTSRAHLYAWPDTPLDAGAERRFRGAIDARRTGVPVAYITGRRGFHALELEVCPGVLVPRSETELLVELALQLELGPRARVLDAGCGSGAIALAIAAERPSWSVFACDISTTAITVARRNARHLGLGVAFVRADWMAPFAPGCFDLVVSNPPYVAAGDPALGGDIRHEPRSALVAGPTGLEALAKLAPSAPLRAQGWLLTEHGHDQGAAVRGLLMDNGYRNVASHRDLAGHERATLGQRP